jgi:signal transduction histidine kinase/ligand-binding sensor domain-containing protein
MRSCWWLCLAVLAVLPSFALEPAKREERRVWTIEHGLPSNHVLSVWRAGHGPLWVGTDAGLARFNGFSFRVYSTLAFTALAETADGVVWAGTRGAGAFRLDSTGPVQVPGLETLVDADVEVMAATADGALWIGTASGLARWGEGRLSMFRVRDGLPRKRVDWLVPISRDTVTVGTEAGAAEFGPKGWLRESGAKQPPKYIQQKDAEGNTWTGGVRGLERLRRNSFETLGRAEGLPTDDARVVVAALDGGFWIGTGEGLVHTRRGLISGLPDAAVTAVLELPGSLLYAGTHGHGLWQSVGRQWRYVEVPGGAGMEYVLCLRRARDGSIWAGTSGGVVRINSGQMEHFGKPDGLSSNGVHDLLEAADGSLWAATDAGLSQWTGKGWRIEEAAGRRIYYAVQHDGSGGLWLAAKDGLFRWRAGVLTSLSVQEAACAGRALSLVAGENELWWKTDRGVCSGTVHGSRLNSRLGAPAAGFRMEAGWQPAGARDSEGRFLFATGAGVLRFGRESAPEPPSVSIERIRVGSEVFEFSGPLALTAGQDNFEIDYAALALAHPERITYRYRLAGFDADWLEAGRRRTVAYSHLPRQRFQFEVSARSANGDWGPSTMLELRLEPHFYQTAWFTSLLVLALLGTGFALHRWRIAVTHRRWALIADERARIARELHDMLAQGIGGISAQLEAAHMLWGSVPAKAKVHVDQARGLARSSLDEVRGFVRALRGGASAEVEFENGLLAMAGEVGNGTVRVKVEGKPRPLAPPVQVCVSRVAREAVNNALRHGEPTRVELSLTYQDSGVRLRVWDDGKGFDPEIAKQGEIHFGLMGMRERAEQVGGSLTISSGPGTGAVVELAAPYG